MVYINLSFLTLKWLRKLTIIENLLRGLFNKQLIDL